MRYSLVLAFLVATSAIAAESKPDKDRRECNKQAEAAANKVVAETPMQHPGDAVLLKQRARQNEFNKCMRLAGHSSGPVRTK